MSDSDAPTSPGKEPDGKPQQESIPNEQSEKVAPAHPPQVQNATKEQVTQFVSTIKNAPQQIGEHVIGALQHPKTVAVLSSVVVGPGGQQHIISAAINPSQMEKINGLLAQAQEERLPEAPCVGFHCLIEPSDEAQVDDKNAPELS